MFIPFFPKGRGLTAGLPGDGSVDPGTGNPGGTPEAPVETQADTVPVTGSFTIEISPNAVTVGENVITSQNGNISLSVFEVAGYDILANVGVEYSDASKTITPTLSGGVYTVEITTVGEVDITYDIQYSDIRIVKEIVTKTEYITDPLVISYSPTVVRINGGDLPARNDNIVVGTFELEGTDLLPLAGTSFTVGTLDVASGIAGDETTFTITPQSADTQINYSIEWTDEGPVSAEPAAGAVESDSTVYFTDETIVTEHLPDTFGDEIAVFTQAGKTFKAHVLKGTKSVIPAEDMFIRALYVPGGSGGGASYAGPAFEAGGGAGSAATIINAFLKAGEAQSCGIQSGASGGTSTGVAGGNTNGGIFLGYSFPGAVGGASLSKNPVNLANIANYGGFTASDKTVTRAPVYGGFRSGESTVSTTDPGWAAGSGGAGAGSPGGDTITAERKAGKGGEGLDISQEFPFYHLKKVSAGGPGSARSKDGEPVFQGDPASTGSGILEPAAPNTGNGGGAGGNSNIDKGNGGSGLIIIKYRIA
jgi:hypothetical protein